MLELGIYGERGDGEAEKLANVIVDPIKDRHGRSILTVRDQNTFAEKMKSHGIFRDVHQDVGEIIVADVNQPRIDELLASDHEALQRLIRKED